MTEIIFLLEEAIKGRYTAKALGEASLQKPIHFGYNFK